VNECPWNLIRAGVQTLAGFSNREVGAILALILIVGALTGWLSVYVGSYLNLAQMHSFDLHKHVGIVK
jgi:hypothetical protein